MGRIDLLGLSIVLAKVADPLLGWLSRREVSSAGAVGLGTVRLAVAASIHPVQNGDVQGVFPRRRQTWWLLPLLNDLHHDFGEVQIILPWVKKAPLGHSWNTGWRRLG